MFGFTFQLMHTFRVALQLNTSVLIDISITVILFYILMKITETSTQILKKSVSMVI